MKRRTPLQENLLKIIFKKIFLFYLIFLFNNPVIAKETWVVDKSLSKITFEVPVLFATNVLGEFKNFEGFVELDLEDMKNNKAVLSVKIDSINLNYEKYKDLILSPIFFDSLNHPIGVIDTKKFTYKNEKNIKLNVELTLKNISKIIETQLKVDRLTQDIVQITGKLELKRNDFNIGTGSWKNTTILKNKIKIETEIFLIKE